MATRFYNMASDASGHKLFDGSGETADTEDCAVDSLTDLGMEFEDIDDLSATWTGAKNPAVNSRSLHQLSYRGRYSTILAPGPAAEAECPFGP